MRPVDFSMLDKIIPDKPKKQKYDPDKIWNKADITTSLLDTYMLSNPIHIENKMEKFEKFTNFETLILPEINILDMLPGR